MNMKPPMVGVPLLVLVPAGADVQNGLPELELVQIGDQKITAARRYGKANGGYNQYCCCIHRRNSPVILVLSWVQGLFLIGEHSPQHLFQIHEQAALEPDDVAGAHRCPHCLGEGGAIGVLLCIGKAGFVGSLHIEVGLGP